MPAPDDGSRFAADTDRLHLRRYDASITRLRAGFDVPPAVTYNRRVPGRLSRSPRQVDILFRGPAFGIQVTAVVECRQSRRPVDLSGVERFVGKLLDLDADRGIFYSCSGFTWAARARAAAARWPAVMAVALDEPVTRPRIPVQRRAPGAEGQLPPYRAEEITEADFALFLWQLNAATG